MCTFVKSSPQEIKCKCPSNVSLVPSASLYFLLLSPAQNLSSLPWNKHSYKCLCLDIYIYFSWISLKELNDWIIWLVCVYVTLEDTKVFCNLFMPLYNQPAVCETWQLLYTLANTCSSHYFLRTPFCSWHIIILFIYLKYN